MSAIVHGDEGWLVITPKSDNTHVVAGYFATRASALATVRGMGKWGLPAEAIPAAGLPRTPGSTLPEMPEYAA